MGHASTVAGAAITRAGSGGSVEKGLDPPPVCTWPDSGRSGGRA